MRAKTGSGKTVVIVVLAVVGVIVLANLMCAGVVAVMMIPAIEQARGVAKRQESMNNLKRIGLALHNYHHATGMFPPAILKEEDGTPRNSWRMLLLPFMADNYADDYNYGAAWDDPQNQAVAEKYQNVYASPNVDQPGYTPYVAVVGPRTVITDAEGRSAFRDITDGSSNTIFIIEDVHRPVRWNAPNDISPDEVLARYQQGDFPEPGILVLMADGSVRMVPPGQAKALELMMDRADGQIIPADF